jgi:ketosteroid isomerase-like protein
VELRERVLAAYAAWNRGDLDGWLELMHPDVRLSAAGIFLGLEPEYRGRDGLARFWRQIHEPWEGFALEVERLDEAGDDCFVAAIRFRARGVESGVEVDMPFGHALRVRDGLAVEIFARASPEEARAALLGEG